MVAHTQAQRGPEDISLIVLHCTDGEGDTASVVRWWEQNGIEASYHYLIDRDGKTNQLVDPEDISWHANNWEINKRSIGISLVGKAAGFKATRAQLISLRNLLARLSYDYELSLRRIYDYSQGRVPMPFGVGQHANVQGADHTDIQPEFPLRRICAEARAHRNTVLGALRVERR